MSSVTEIVTLFFKECPILDDKSTRVEVLKFFLKLLLFMQVHVINFEVSPAYRSFLKEFNFARRETFGNGCGEDDSVDETSQAGASDVVDDCEGEQDDIEEQEGIESEFPFASSSTSSSKESSSGARKEQKKGGSDQSNNQMQQILSLLVSTLAQTASVSARTIEYSL